MALPVSDFLSGYAAAFPDKLGVQEGDTVLDYAELNRRTNRVAAVLVDLGVRSGTKLVWCGQNGLEVVVLVHAARKAGAVAVPLNYRLTPEEAAYVIDNSDSTVVLFDVEQAEQLQSAPAACPKVAHWVALRCAADSVPDWAEHLESLAAEASDAEVSPVPAPAGSGGDSSAEDAGATMIYTSGTTGKPKGALRRGGDPAVAAALIGHIGFSTDDVYLTTGPLYHSGPLGFMGIVQALGGSVVVQRHFEPAAWLGLVQRHRITTTFSAPTPLRRVLDLPADVRSRYATSSL
ncbi:hypothetical protein BH18ACT1_BH18ACT1_03310 [soil metagenome]